MVRGNSGNQFRQYDGQNTRNQIGYNAGQIVGNQNGYNALQNTWNQNGNGNVVAARAEGIVNGNNANQIRCYNCRGVGHYARNYTVRPRRRDVAYLQTQLLITQKEEAGIQLQAKEFYLMDVVVDNEEIEEVNMDQLSSSKTITTLNEEIANLNNQLSKEKSIVSYLQKEREKLKSDFKTCKNELLDKLIDSEKKIKELDNILLETGQSIQSMHMLSP
ncbi:hypothetical protein Tco_0717618 [Tanacetum coccineum]